MVIIVATYAPFVTSHYDVIFTFPIQRFSTVLKHFIFSRQMFAGGFTEQVYGTVE